jgi:uncharacterized membrane protein YfcA
MTLFGLAPPEIRTTALTLNILVASIATWQFAAAGHFRWSLFWPFALLAPPLAFVGGYVSVPTSFFKIAVGVVLLLSAAQLLVRPPQEREAREPRRAVAVATGAGLGLLAGLTGTGGGIFLTPLLVFTGWAQTRQAAAVSALFILLNSIAGLAGNLTASKQLPDFALPLAVAVVVGGAIGSYLGSRRLAPLWIKRLLAIVLVIAGFKLIFA